MLSDTLGRPLRNLRLSVTDRCNLRCEYCMPEAEYQWLPREDVLHFEETRAVGPLECDAPWTAEPPETFPTGL